MKNQPPDLRAAYGTARSFQDATLFPGLTVTEAIQVALGRGHKIGVVPAMLGAPWVRSRERTSHRQANEILARTGPDPELAGLAEHAAGLLPELP